MYIYNVCMYICMYVYMYIYIYMGGGEGGEAAAVLMKSTYL